MLVRLTFISSLVILERKNGNIFRKK